MGMTKQLSVAYHSLSTLLEAGVPIIRSLTTTASTSTGRLQKAFSALVKDISAGDSLASAMAHHSDVFAPLDLTLIEAAETSGNLAESFKYLSQWYEFRQRLKNILISGLMLPLAILHIAIAIGPLPALFLGGMSLAEYAFIEISSVALLYGTVGIIYALLRMVPPGSWLRWLLDAMMLRIPVLGQALRQITLSRYCRAFNMLYRAGVPITQCAQKALSVTGNAVIADLLKGGTQSAQAGGLIWEGFSHKLPLEFLQLWQIGEETGELDATVARLAVNTAETGQMLFVEFCRWLPRVIYFAILISVALLIIKSFTMVISSAGI